MQNKRPLLFVVITLLSFGLSYYGVLAHQYPMSPGDDIFPHLATIERILQHGLAPYAQSYPQGFHLIVIAVSKLFNIDALRAITLVAPALLPCSGIALYLLARSITNRSTALLAYALFALVSFQPLQTYFDGSLPNLWAAGILLPLALLFLIKGKQGAFRTTWPWYIAWVLMSGLILYSHHLSTLVYFGVLFVFATFLWVKYVISSPNWWQVTIRLTIPIVIFAGFIYVFLHGALFQPERQLAQNFIDIRPRQFPFVFSVITIPRETWSIKRYGLDLGGIIFQMSFVALTLVAVRWRRFSSTKQVGLLLLSTWFLIYFLGSQATWSGEPGRLARDLALPASILTAWVILKLYNYSWQYSKPVAAVFLLVVAILSVSAFKSRIDSAVTYSAMVRFSRADQQAYEYLLSTNKSKETTILAKEPNWATVALIKKTTNKFFAITKESQYQESSLQTSKCYLVGWYYPGVWPAALEDKSIINSLITNKNFEVAEVFADVNKEWRLVCRRNKPGHE